VKDLFSSVLLLVGLPPELRQNEGALRVALSRYGTVTSVQVRPRRGIAETGLDGWFMDCVAGTIKDEET